MKKIISLVLVAVIMLSTSTWCFALTRDQLNTADALNSLEMLLGNGSKGYDLDSQLMRSDGITLLVRLLGKETEAKTGKYSHPFNDVAEWLDPYVAYAYSTSIVNGMDKNTYGSTRPLTQVQFLTMTLRILGYTDSGKNAEFTWDKPFTLAKKVGLITSTKELSTFTRGDAITVFWNALSCKMKSGELLSDYLIEEDAFEAEEFEKAVEIQEKGAEAVGYEPTVQVREVPVDDQKDSSTDTTDTQTKTDKTGDATSEGKSTDESSKNKELTWDEYIAMTPEEQDAYMESFDDLNDYVAWMQKAQAEYNEKNKAIEIDGSEIDLSKM